MSITFEWDSQKDRDNARKHGVTFQEASTVFRDFLSITRDDPEHSSPFESRLITIGRSDRDRLLVVVHIEIDDEHLRLVSERIATRNERHRYEEGL